MTIVLHDLILFGLIAMNIGMFIKTWDSNSRVNYLEEIFLEFVKDFVNGFDE